LNLSISIDPSRPEELDAAAELVALLRRQMSSNAAENVAEHMGWKYLGRVDLPPDYPASADDRIVKRAVDDLWPRLGDTLRDLLIAAATFERPYTTQELAETLGTDTATAKSWRANLGRSLNAVAKNFPAAPPFFDEHANPEGGWKYALNPLYVPLIREKSEQTTDVSSETQNEGDSNE
jgi:hypothetical protein